MAGDGLGGHGRGGRWPTDISSGSVVNRKTNGYVFLPYKSMFHISRQSLLCNLVESQLEKKVGHKVASLT